MQHSRYFPLRSTIRRRALLTSVAGGFAGGTLSRSARAQAPYPDRPVTVIVTYGAGGAVDTVARVVFAKVSERLGQPFVVENRAGGGGTIGATAAARAKPDGLTLMDDASGFAINPALRPRLPYDAKRDFIPIVRIAAVPNTIVAGPACPAQTLAELIALAKARPDDLDCATTGTGSSQHLTLELFNRIAGVRINHVPYRDTPAAQNDVLAGRIALYCATATSAAPHHNQGGLRILAHTGDRPVEALPGVPAASATLPGFESLEWHGLFAPKGTPDQIVQRLNAELNAVLGDPDVLARLSALAAQAEPNTPEQFQAFVAAEIEKWGRVAREANIHLD
jgi:tripartite-type tricarboxylate transporter receptor subunit TctC